MDLELRRAEQKQCSDEKPCDSCPKNNASGSTSWKAVGCKRGTLRDETQAVNIYPRSYIEDLAIETIPDNQASIHLDGSYLCKHQWCQGEYVTECPQCNEEPSEPHVHHDADMSGLGRTCIDRAAQRRDEDIANESALQGDPATPLGSLLLTLKGTSIVEDLGLSYRPTSPDSALTSLVPLDQCILAITWEILDQPSHLSILSLFNEEVGIRLTSFVVLLRSAALYQAKLESVSISMSSCVQ
jgi:hypothetical protein